MDAASHPHLGPADLQVLLELTRVMARQPALEQALQAVTDAALALLPADHASLRLFDASRNELLSGARSGAGADERPLTFRMGEGVAGWVALHGQAARVDDAMTDARFVAMPGQGFSIRSMLALPLVSAGATVGVLAVTAAEPRRFDDEHALILQVLANTATGPLERARLERLALTDHLTLALNQRALLPRLEQEIERSRRYAAPLAVLLLDLDHFKAVNDTHGHAVGDLVLRQFADRVRLQARRVDTLVRRGGEEFCLIMPHTRAEQAVVVAERIRADLVATPLWTGQLAVTQTVSIGVAQLAPDEDAPSIDRRADAAMYAAKRAGRNRVAVAPPPGESPGLP